MTSTVDPIQVARDAGFDIDLIDTNLALTPEERLRQHDEAVNVMLALQEARRANDAKLHPPAGATR